ncbi:hypothetical protein ACFQV8_15715 [Pseudonocardia benzenivorans]
MLVAHGFGGSKASVDADARDLAARGYVVLTWSARGSGPAAARSRSTHPTTRSPTPGGSSTGSRSVPRCCSTGRRPRVGVTGGSYGGALSLLLAGYDKRIDAIAPVITYNDLGQALFPDAAGGTPPPADTPAARTFGDDGVFKRGWAGIFFSAGASPAGAAGSQAASVLGGGTRARATRARRVRAQGVRAQGARAPRVRMLRARVARARSRARPRPASRPPLRTGRR